MSKKSILILVIIIILLIGGYFTYSYIQPNSVSYQMNKLKNGTAKEKINAATFLGDNKITEAIPLLIENVGNENRDLWHKEPKSGKIAISCVVTYELENITGLKLGNTCYWSTDSKEENNDVISKWKDWYENEYQKTN